MCVAALTVASIVLGAAGSLMQYQGQQQQYKAAVAHRNEQAKQAQETLNQQVAQQNSQYESDLNKVQNEKFLAKRGKLAAQSKQQAVSAESGVSGLSVANLMGDIDFEEGLFMGQADYNQRVGYSNANNSLRMAQRGAQAQIAAIPIPTAPSFGPTLVNIGSSVVGGFQQHYRDTALGDRGTPGVSFV